MAQDTVNLLGLDSPGLVHLILIDLNRLFLESHSQSSTQTHTLQYLGLSLFAYTTLPWNIEPVQSPHLSTSSPASYLVCLTLNPFTWKKGNHNITRWGVPCRWGYPGGKSGKEPTCQYRRCRWDPWVAKIPCSMKWQLAPVLLSGEFHGQRSLAGYSLWGHRVRHDWVTTTNTTTTTVFYLVHTVLNKQGFSHKSPDF